MLPTRAVLPHPRIGRKALTCAPIFPATGFTNGAGYPPNRKPSLDYWQPDLVSFLIGCSFTFEQALMEEGIPIRHIECGCNVPMYRTNRQCRPAGPFHGPLVVSMRPVPGALVAEPSR